MKRRPLARTAPLSILLTLAALALIGASPAQGASLTVDATHDAVDASPGDGVCADAGGACTLRAAVMETNALAGADEISLPAATYVLSIPGAGEDASATGDLDVEDDLTISGAGRDATVIDGGGIDRVFHAKSSLLLALADLLIENGVAGGSMVTDACNSGPDPTDPAFANGGGVCTETANVELVRMTLRNNSAGVGGAAIHNAGQLRLKQSLVIANSSGGGAIRNGGSASIEKSTVADNSGAVIGGGIRNDSNGTLDVADSTVRGNTAVDAGGGIFNGGTAAIKGSTIADNVAGQSGGGVHNSAVAEFTNSTISNNTARFGGGIYNNPEPLPPGLIGESRVRVTSQSLGGLVKATNVTLADNSASERGGGILNPEAAAGSGTVDFQNTIVAFNHPGGDCSGPITSAGHNANVDGTCALSGPGDFPNAELALLPLADNGGPTQTHALPRLNRATDVVIRNDAIDGGDSASCPPIDQRGEVRPFDGDGDQVAECDIGAFELREAPLVCEPGPCGVQFTTPSPMPTPGPTPDLPVILPSTGGAEGPPSATPYALAAVAAIAAATFGARVWRMRKRSRH